MAFVTRCPQTVNAVTGFSGSTPAGITYNYGFTASTPTLQLTSNSGLGSNNIKIFGTARSDSYGGWIGCDLARQPGNGLYIAWNPSDVAVSGESQTGFCVEFQETSNGDLILILMTADYIFSGTETSSSGQYVWRTHEETTHVGSGTSSNGHAGYAYVELALNTNGVAVRVDGDVVMVFATGQLNQADPWWHFPSGTNSCGVYTRRTYTGTEDVARTLEISHHIPAQPIAPSTATYIVRHAYESGTENPWVPNVDTAYASAGSPSAISTVNYVQPTATTNSYVITDDRSLRGDVAYEQTIRLYGTNKGACMTWNSATNSFVWVNCEAFAGFGDVGIVWSNGY